MGEKLAEKYNPEGLFPFPFEKIQQNHNDLAIHMVDLSKSISGAITFDDEIKSYIIFINRNETNTRQYFTTAHELGHYFLHKEKILKNEAIIDSESTLDSVNILLRLDKALRTEIEYEANNFAASLLMPSALVKQTWESLQDVKECAKIFNVSLSAMSVRLERLGLAD